MLFRIQGLYLKRSVHFAFHPSLYSVHRKNPFLVWNSSYVYYHQCLLSIKIQRFQQDVFCKWVEKFSVTMTAQQRVLQIAPDYVWISTGPCYAYMVFILCKNVVIFPTYFHFFPTWGVDCPDLYNFILPRIFKSFPMGMRTTETQGGYVWTKRCRFYH